MVNVLLFVVAGNVCWQAGQYQDLIAADITAIPDLFFDAHIIVASGDQVACRLLFDCTPQHEFLGFSPNGERLSFAEHVSYHYRDGRIAAVSSLIDRSAIEAQLRLTQQDESSGVLAPSRSCYEAATQASGSETPDRIRRRAAPVVTQSGDGE
jgi:predicted ester cyclase